jgi:predicted TIM-barrel fold metal-dependent hydrolase
LAPRAPDFSSGETMIRYQGPIIDTHHHIWERKDVAWLRDPPIIRAIGDFFALRRDIPVEEWMHDVVPENVVKSVHVTANWGPGRGLDETRWLQSVSDKHGFPHAFVCQADLADPDVESHIKAQKQFPAVRGLRHQLHWDSAPLKQNVSRPDLCNTPEFRRGFALLEKYDLHFELQVFAAQASYAVELIRAFPNVRFILVHSGMLTDRSIAAIEQWRAALTQIAAFPNVHTKISGLNMFNPNWTQKDMRQVIRDSIQIFGIDRTIYGSNFPLEKLHSSYANLLESYRVALAEYPEADQRKVFHDNAVAFYRL